MTDYTQLRKLAEAVPPSHLLSANNWGRLDDFRHAANPQAIIELLDEIERLRKDAERWQWWRKNEGAANRIWRAYLENCSDVECLDFEVDAAMVK